MEEDLLVSKIKNCKEEGDLLIVSVYNTCEWNKLEKAMRRVMEKGREMSVIIGGNFNIKIGEERGSMEGG